MQDLRDKEDEVIVGTDNVFADLDLDMSEEDMIKVHVALAITATVKKRGLTQNEAARIAGTDQARISNVLRGQIKRFSVEGLLKILVMLGRDVEIRIPKRFHSQRGKIKLIAA